MERTGHPLRYQNPIGIADFQDAWVVWFCWKVCGLRNLNLIKTERGISVVIAGISRRITRKSRTEVIYGAKLGR